MKTFEKSYQEAIKENGCNAGETFARFMFRAGADNLISQSVENGKKKHQQGMDFMKYKAIEAYKKTCSFSPPGCCGCKNENGECDCEELKNFIEELNS